MAYVNRKFTWDTNMLKRLYEKYVIGWLHRDQNWTEEEKFHGIENLGIKSLIPISSGGTSNSIIQKNVNCNAMADPSFAVGLNTSALGQASFAEGYMSTARGLVSHAEGSNTMASGRTSHAEGSGCTANGNSSHAGGSYSIANGNNSFVHGDNLLVNNEGEASFGKYNRTRNGLLFSVGNGTSDYNRKNVFEVDELGDIYITYNNSFVSLKNILDSLINSIQSLGGTVNLPY